jgi:hypothetical protein
LTMESIIEGELGKHHIHHMSSRMLTINSLARTYVGFPYKTGCFLFAIINIINNQLVALWPCYCFV